MGSIRVETQGAIATLTISNPGKRNAISAEMWSSLPSLLTSPASDPAVKVLVVRGEGEDFSAGADIGKLDRILPVGSEGGLMTAAEDALADFPKPTIAAINGFCVGGGWELAAACDLRICSDRSTFGVTPSRLGIVYPLSGIKRLVAIAGPAVAKHILFTGEIVDAATAFGWGLVSKVLAVDGFWDEVARFSESLASRSQFSIRAMKPIVDALVAGEAAAEIASEWAKVKSNDRQIGVQAFLSKRQPHFEWGSKS